MQRTSTYCVLDIETAGGDLGNIPCGFQLLFVGLKWQGENLCYGAEPHELGIIGNFLQTLSGTLVTFNGEHFDLPILEHHFKEGLAWVPEIQRHYDILKEIFIVTGRRISLAELARLNLGLAKGQWDHRRNARVWKEKPHLLREHNRVDLELTAGIYEMILRGERIKVGSTSFVLTWPE